MSAPEERAKVRRWQETAEEAAREAEQAQAWFDTSTEHDRAIDAGALVSIALSLSVIAEVVVEALAEEADR